MKVARVTFVSQHFIDSSFFLDQTIIQTIFEVNGVERSGADHIKEMILWSLIYAYFYVCEDREGPKVERKKKLRTG